MPGLPQPNGRICTTGHTCPFTHTHPHILTICPKTCTSSPLSPAPVADTCTWLGGEAPCPKTVQEWPLLLWHLCQEAGQEVPHLQVSPAHASYLAPAPEHHAAVSFSSCRRRTCWTRCLSLERLSTSLVEGGRLQEQEEQGQQEEEGEQDSFSDEELDEEDFFDEEDDWVIIPEVNRRSSRGWQSD